MMKDTKAVFKYFTIMDDEKEGEYLREMHKQGWRLEKVTFPGIYRFSACEPEDVCYQLDYNQDGVAHKTDYVQMFADCGWEYLFDFVGYSYFRKPADQMEGEESIFCDDESRLEMIKRVYKGRVVPLIFIFFGCILPQLFMNSMGYGEDHTLHVFQNGLSVTFLILACLYLIIFASFGWKVYQYEKKVYGVDGDLKLKYMGIVVILTAAAILAVGIFAFF